MKITLKMYGSVVGGFIKYITQDEKEKIELLGNPDNLFYDEDKWCGVFGKGTEEQMLDDFEDLGVSVEDKDMIIIEDENGDEIHSIEYGSVRKEECFSTPDMDTTHPYYLRRMEVSKGVLKLDYTINEPLDVGKVFLSLSRDDGMVTDELLVSSIGYGDLSEEEFGIDNGESKWWETEIIDNKHYKE